MALQSTFLSTAYTDDAAYDTSLFYEAGGFNNIPSGHAPAFWTFPGTPYVFGSAITSNGGAGSDFTPVILANFPAGNAAFGYGGETDSIPRNGDPFDFSTIMVAKAGTLKYGDGRWVDGMTYVGRPHGGGLLQGSSLFFSASLDTMSGAADAESGLTTLIENTIARYNLPVPVAFGDLTGATSPDVDFYSDYWCHGPYGTTYAGYTWVAAMRSGGAAALPSSGLTWTTTWCSGASDKIGWGDFDGDRIVDSYCYHTATSSIDVALNQTGSGSNTLGTPSSWTTSWSCYDSSARVTMAVGDVDGDGRDDIICNNHMTGNSYDGDVWVAQSTGSSFGSTNQWSTAYAGSSSTFCIGSDNLFGSADFDGDGLSDIWCFDHSAGFTYVQLSGGSATAGFDDPYNTYYTYWLGYSGSWCAASLSTIDFGAADLNGDGMADLYCHNKSNGAFYFVAGRGEFLHAGQQSSGQAVGGFRYIYNSSSTLNGSLASYCSGAQMGLGDFNADGRMDLYCHSGSTTTIATITSANTAGSSGNNCDNHADPGTGCPDGTSCPQAQVHWGLNSATTVLTSWCPSGYQFGSAN